jgi:hypothetical protein
MILSFQSSLILPSVLMLFSSFHQTTTSDIPTKNRDVMIPVYASEKQFFKTEEEIRIDL